MATPRTEYYNFAQTYNLGTLQPIGYGPFPLDNPTGFTTLRFSGLSLVTARKPQQYVQTDYHLNILLFDPSDPTKYATYKSNPIATGTPTNPGTSVAPIGTATFADGDYTISTDVSDWNLFGGIASLDGLCVGFYSDASSSFPTTTDCPDRHLSPVPSGSYKYWMWELSPATPGNNSIKYSREEMVEKYANSIDSCPIFADRSTKDANGDVIDTTYLKIANMPAIPTAGRNMNLNQYNAMQTNLPGGLFDAPANQSNDFTRLTGADFAGAYRLACRHNTSDNYELAIAYTASGMSSSYSFIGTETIVAIDNSVTTKQAVYLGETCVYTPTTKFGGVTSTAFDPTRHKAIIYDGIGQIGPTSDCKIAIYSDANSNVKIAFTAIEVGKVGSTT